MLRQLYISFLLLFYGVSNAQNILSLKTGNRAYTTELSMAALKTINAMQGTFGYISFNKIPGISDKNKLKNKGISLLQYLPTKQYTAKFSHKLSLMDLEKLNIQGIIIPNSTLKIDPALSNPQVLKEIEKVTGFIDIIISTYTKKTALALTKHSIFKKVTVLKYATNTDQDVALRIPKELLKPLARLNEVLYLQALANEVEPINYNSKANHRAAFLNATLKNLHGSGVAIGVGDGGYTAPHLDWNKRLHNLQASAITSFGNHGDHVAGTVGGSGMINTDNTGMAPKSTIYTGKSAYFITNLTSSFDKYGIVLSNNSYGNPGNCTTFGNYSSTSAYIDNSLFANPYFLHIFAAGNLGGSTCAPYPAGYGNIYPHYQVSKNILTVGAVSNNDAIAGFSSRGPAKDGRIKPEICGVGVGTMSTIPSNNYGSKNGTSMASPGVCGSLALLVERYRQLHSGNNPEGALLKVLAMNTADDKGNAAVDFRYGYGRINIACAEESLSNNHYLKDSVAHGITNTHNIVLPLGVGKLKVMIHWREPAGLTSAKQAIVNNLDLTATNPLAVVSLPWKLDTAKANVGNLAVRGIDSINTQEQVTIDNPMAGTYHLKVKGTSIGSGKQAYWLTYHYTTQKVHIRYPNGGEYLNPGTTETLKFDIDNVATGTFTLQYSTDNGTTWTNINTAISRLSNSYNWSVPNTITKDALIRLNHNSIGTIKDTSDANFNILGQPNINLTTCQNSIKLTWTSVTGANSYDVFIFKDGEWKFVNNVNTNNSLIPNLTQGNNYWVTVCAKTTTGVISKKAVAKNITVGTGSCNTGIDAGIDQVSAPSNGRILTSSALTATQQFTINIRNFGTVNLTNIPIKYTVNGGATKNLTWTGNLLPNTQTLKLSFPENFATANTYTLKIWTEYPGDVEAKNDTITHVLRQVSNPNITLPHIENFEGAPIKNYSTNQFALTNLDAMDYTNSHKNCELRFTNRPDLAFSGNRAVLLHKSVQNNNLRNQAIMITKNLSLFDTSTAKIFLKFQFLHANEEKHNGDSVWLRGTDTNPWINFYNWWDNKSAAGEFKTAFIDISKVLKNNGQNFSSSFQVKFGQEDNGIMRNAHDSDGLVIDDFELLELSDDIAVVKLISPQSGCGLGSADSVISLIANNGKSNAAKIAIKYKLNGGIVVVDTLYNLNVGDTIRFASPQTINIAAPGLHTIQVWVDYLPDTYLENDSSALITFRNIKRATGIPDLQNFESNNGNFYTEGINNTWAWGAPSYFKGRAVSGNKIWATGLSSTHNNNEISSLISQCYDFSGIGTKEPILSYHMAYDIEDNFDKLWVEYSEDGTNWTKLGTTTGGTNWYNDGLNLFDAQFKQWRVHSYKIPTNTFSNKNDVQIRFKFVADGGLTLGGAYIDDVHIFVDTAEILGGTGITNLKEKSTGAGWVHFTSGGKRVASIFDDNKNLDSISLGVLVRTGVPRNIYNQYTMNRNWWINPTNKDSGNFKLRLYFNDSEFTNLDAADDTVNTIFDLGVTKYDGANEDHDFLNNPNTSGNIIRYLQNNLLAIIPYNTGYYIEFPVDSFSEFWINGGLPSHLIPLPIEWIYARGEEQISGNKISWQTTYNDDVSNYKVYRKCLNSTHPFELLGTIPHILYKNSYTFLDKNTHTCSRWMYKIEAILHNGETKNSPLIRIGKNIKILNIYPNPFSQYLQLIFSKNKTIEPLNIFNVNGKLLYQKILNKGTQQSSLNLQYLLPGIYFIEYKGERVKVVKVE